MSRDAAYLLDILNSSRLALRYLGDSTRDRFFEDIECQDAVIRRLLVVGEAARRVSSETRQELSNLPWAGMIAMRNLMVHEYDDVDLNVVWDTIQSDLPSLIAVLEGVLRPPMPS